MSGNGWKVPLRDPWARFEAWRYAPEINRRANVRAMFPGFMWGLGVFIVAVGIETIMEKNGSQAPNER
jgi:NADH dehydrogenase (ubiquinone) 1 beta subcomplex subunit 3